MIYPRLNKLRNGQQLSVELVNGLIKRTEYAADLLKEYRILNGTTRKNGTTVSVTPATPSTTIELEAGILYSVSGDQVNIDGIVPTFTLSPIALANGLLITGGTWEWNDRDDGSWRVLLDVGYISPFELANFYAGFRPSNFGYDSSGTPYWNGGTIRVFGT